MDAKELLIEVNKLGYIAKDINEEDIAKSLLIIAMSGHSGGILSIFNELSRIVVKTMGEALAAQAEGEKHDLTQAEFELSAVLSASVTAALDMIEPPEQTENKSE